MEFSVAIAMIFHFSHGTTLLGQESSHTQHCMKGANYILIQILKKLKQIDIIRIAPSDISFCEEDGQITSSCPFILGHVF